MVSSLHQTFFWEMFYVADFASAEREGVTLARL